MGNQRRNCPGSIAPSEHSLRRDRQSPTAHVSWYPNHRSSICHHGTNPLLFLHAGVFMWQGPRAERAFQEISCITFDWCLALVHRRLMQQRRHSLDAGPMGMQVDYPRRVTSWQKSTILRMTRKPRPLCATCDFGDRGIVWEGQSCESAAVSKEQVSGSAFPGEKDLRANRG